MRINIVCVGKIKEKYLKLGIDEFKKRLSKYCKLEIIELEDEKAPENLSDKEMLMIKEKEGKKILSKIKDNSYVIALAIDGKNLSSEELAETINKLGVRGVSNITFVIGGSLGLSDEVLSRADYNRLKDIICVELVPNSRGLTTREFYDQVVSVGGEGLVVKDLDSLYDIRGKRAGEWVKIKRSVTGSVLEQNYGDTFDCFVIGFNEGQKGTKNEGLVGSLNFGIYLLDENNKVILDERGIPQIHHICTVGGLPDKLREAITVKDFNGNVQLRPDIYAKVATVDGQDVSDKNMRLAHARLIQWRVDKSADQCTIRKDFLERLVL